MSRTRWLAVKLGVVGACSVLVDGLLSLMVTWWSGPFDQAYQVRITLAVFHSSGIVPVGYAAFAFALGVTAGMIIRRTLPAMAVTLVIFAAVQLAVPFWVRPHLIPPVTTTSAVNLGSVVEWGASNAGQGNGGDLFFLTQPDVPGAWLLSNKIITRPAVPPPPSQAPLPAAGAHPRCSRAATTSPPCTCGKSSATSPRAATGRCSGTRPGSTSWLPSCWRGSASSGSVLGRPAGSGVGRGPGQLVVLQSGRPPAASHQSV